MPHAPCALSWLSSAVDPFSTFLDLSNRRFTATVLLGKNLTYARLSSQVIQQRVTTFAALRNSAISRFRVPMQYELSPLNQQRRPKLRNSHSEHLAEGQKLG